MGREGGLRGAGHEGGPRGVGRREWEGRGYRECRGRVRGVMRGKGEGGKGRER